ncbi:DNA mismatch repair protein MutS, partial [bacterium]|nr:DNA mismatch repair protein MutS [candidate division CSSED10-310 bacterium]
MPAKTPNNHAQDPGLTPMLQQYREIKQAHADCILFFRMGDFYEMFFDDAVRASRILNIALTSRDKDSDNPTPMCGFPHHAATTYIARLIGANLKVAICEQVEDPKKARGLVKREVIKIITPGTVLDQNLLDARANNYLMAIHERRSGFGAAYIDLSTGDFAVAQFGGERGGEDLGLLLETITPSELLVPESISEALLRGLQPPDRRIMINRLPDFDFAADAARDDLQKHLGVHSLHGFGCEDMPLAIGAAGALLSYLRDTQKHDLDHLKRLRVHRFEGVMVLDQATLRNLELTRTILHGSRTGTLLDLLDRAITPMGSRTIRNWLLQPLTGTSRIAARQ